MRKIAIWGVLALMALALAAVPAIAANPHFIGTPTGTDIGTQLRVSGKVAGLGSDPVNVVVNATGTATVQCENPAGNIAPGQDTTVNASGQSGPITPRNGQITFTTLTLTPTVPDVPTCPNAKWDAQVTDVTFTSATVSVFDVATGALLTSSTVRL